MQSLKKLYRIGLGPSSSHTMGPRRAAERFAERHPNHKTFVVSLYGSLAATGKGHLTDIAIIGGLPSGSDVTIDWQKHETLPLHTNGMIFKAIGEKGEVLDSYTCYSVGGGSVVDEDSEGGPPGFLLLVLLISFYKKKNDRVIPDFIFQEPNKERSMMFIMYTP